MFAIAFGIDRFTKLSLERFVSMKSFGPFTFEAHRNAGFILQSFEGASAWSRIVFVASLYGFLFFSYFFLEWLLPASVKRLRLAITLFAAAITGNFYDRAFEGSVLDFVTVNFASQSFYFNFADVFMWVGLAGVLMEIFKEGDRIWHPRDKRKQWLIDGAYQLRSAIQSGLVALSLTLILTLFTYTYLASSTHSDLALPCLYCMSALGLLFTIVSFVFSVLISHRSAGPLFAFEKYVESLLRGESTKFSLREKDEHQKLILLARKLKTRLEGTEDHEDKDIKNVS
jgi:signal peptidase II